MLLAQHLPKMLWGTAALHAVYLHNRAFTRAIPDKTPFKHWHRKWPNVEHLQEFGIPVSIFFFFFFYIESGLFAMYYEQTGCTS